MKREGLGNTPSTSLGIVQYGAQLLVLLAAAQAQAQIPTASQINFSVNGYYASAANGGGANVTVDRLLPSTWETFTITDLTRANLTDQDQVWLRAQNGNYLSAECGGGTNPSGGPSGSLCGNVDANRTTPLSWETFSVTKVAGSPGSQIDWGDQIAFKSSGGYYCSAENGAGRGSYMDCTRSWIQVWETWTITASRQSGPPTRGAWTNVIPLELIPVAAAVLPTGKVLMWASNGEFSFEGDAGDNPSQTYTALFDPVTGQAPVTLETSALSDMFCPGTAMLADGRVLVNGGSSSPKTSIYNPGTNTWCADAEMKTPRGYNGDVLLSTGQVLTLGGSWSGGLGGKSGEIWSSATGWNSLTGVPADPFTGPDPAGVYRGDNHAWLFQVGGGQVFHAGPTAEMHWIDTAGNSIADAGSRGDDPYSMTGLAVMYDTHKILKTGGAPAYDDANATGNTYVIDLGPHLGDSTLPVSVQRTADMTYPRAFANGVVLPNGQVLVVGGETHGVPFSDDTAILIPELWDPVTRTFTQMNPMQTPRTYHSVALLLPDGRVLSGGGGLCGDGCATNHPNVEIFWPPYLINADGMPAARPTIISAPSQVQAGQTITVSTDGPVSAFSIVRLASVTHGLNNDQRRVPLPIAASNGTTYKLPIPGDLGIVTPGFYLLFAMNSHGTPSMASFIHLD